MEEALNVFWIAWPWFGLGGAVVVCVLLFATDVLRGDTGVPRWRDPAWLAWVLPPLLALHQFEEYACHVSGGQFSFVSQVMSTMTVIDIPLAHFPLMNMVFTWLALPTAALVARRNPVVGLSGYGFVLFNGLTHVMGCLVLGMGPLDNPGFFTGLFLFIPLNVWVAYVCSKGEFMSRKGRIITPVAGILGHLTLFLAYAAGMIGGPAAILVGDVVASFAPMIWAWAGCKLLKA